jgi:hypothetical protein
VVEKIDGEEGDCEGGREEGHGDEQNWLN